MYLPLKRGTYRISSGYRTKSRPGHRGIDFSAPIGTPIYAPFDGKVIQGKDRAPGSVDGFANWVWIEGYAENPYDFIVGHMRHSSILVKAGDRVRAGQKIAEVGNEGQSTGPHAHCELWSRPGRIGGHDIDPTRFWGDNAQNPGGAPAPAPKPAAAPIQSSVPVLDWTNRFLFGRPRSKANIRNIVIHVTVNSPGTPAENVANYQIRSRSGSYHELTDTSIKHLKANTDDWFTWSSGNKGNEVGLHRSFVMWGNETRADWLRFETMLREAAKRDAMWCRTYGIPPVKLSPADLRAGKKGFCGHLETGQAWGGTDHVDPGKGFPWDVYLKFVREYLDGKPTITERADMLTTKFFTDFITAFVGPIISDVKDIRQQITGGRDAGEYPGWSISHLVKNYRSKPGDKGTMPEMLAVALTEIEALRDDIDSLKKGR